MNPKRLGKNIWPGADKKVRKELRCKSENIWAMEVTEAGVNVTSEVWLWNKLHFDDSIGPSIRSGDSYVVAKKRTLQELQKC